MVNLSKLSQGGEETGPPKPVEDIIFTVDDDIYEKTGVRKPKKGEELSGMDAEKLYRYQLVQDKQKIVEKHGTYQEKAAIFHEKRMEELTYATFHTIRPMGHLGRFNEPSNAARELSWRDTSKLTGEVFGTHLLKAPVIAGKRYSEWISGKPKGPSKEYLVDKEQRKEDNELWENIRFARLEKTRTELREESKQRSLEKARERKAEKERNKRKNKDAEKDAAAAHKLWVKERIQEGAFSMLRKLPTKQQQYDSMKGWNTGHQDDWDLSGYGFPKINQPAFAMKNGKRMSHEMVTAGELVVFEGIKYGRGEYMSENDEIRRDFVDYTVENNIKRAENYLIESRKAAKRAERERKKKEEADAKMRHRGAILIQEDLAIDALQAKTAHMASTGAFGAYAQNQSKQKNAFEDEEKEAKKKAAEEARAKKEKEEEEREAAQDFLSDHVSHLLEPSPVDENDEIWDVVEDNIQWDKISIVERKRLRRELANPYSLTSALHKLNLARRNVTRNNVRIVGKKVSRYVRDTSRFVAYQFHPLTFRRRYRYYSRCKFLKDEAVHPEEEEDDDLDEFGEKKKRKKREWEKYTEEELAALDSKDRKRLKAMRARDLEQDAKEEAEKQSAGGRAAAKARQRAKAEDERAKKTPLIRLYRAIFGKKEDSMTTLEKRKAEAKKNAEKLMKEEASNEKAMEMLFSFREKQRQAKEAYNTMLSSITGREYGVATEEFSADDLIRYARLGDYNTCIDILDHPVCPVGPNESNADGISAFFAVLEMTLQNQAADSDENLLSDRTCLQAIKAYFNNRVKAGKLDLVLRALMHKGGDINFVKNERDADGESILHLAASSGKTDMIHWLRKKNANFDVRTTKIKRTALMYAARADKVNATMALLKNGSMININAKDTNGWTALHYAGSFGSPELTRVLLICGANAYERNDRGLIPLDEAMAKGRIGVIEAIRTYKEPDFQFRQLLAFMDMYYLDGAAEVIPELKEEEEEEEED